MRVLIKSLKNINNTDFAAMLFSSIITAVIGLILFRELAIRPHLDYGTFSFLNYLSMASWFILSFYMIDSHKRILESKATALRYFVFFAVSIMLCIPLTIQQVLIFTPTILGTLKSIKDTLETILIKNEIIDN